MAERASVTATASLSASSGSLTSTAAVSLGGFGGRMASSAVASSGSSAAAGASSGMLMEAEDFVRIDRCDSFGGRHDFGTSSMSSLLSFARYEPIGKSVPGVMAWTLSIARFVNGLTAVASASSAAASGVMSASSGIAVP